MTACQERVKAALDARVSNDDHGAIQAQLHHMRRHAEKIGMEPSIQFTDMNGNREEFDWMMAQATSENPPFQRILIYNNSRSAAPRTPWRERIITSEPRYKGAVAWGETPEETHLRRKDGVWF